MRITTQLEKKAKELLHRSIALFFYHCAILFHSVESPYFHKMIEKADMCVGQGIKQPGRTLFLGKLLQNGLNFINASLEDMKPSWKISGYSIMSNEWTNQSSGTLINFLVYYLRGLYVRGSVGVSDKKKRFCLFVQFTWQSSRESWQRKCYAGSLCYIKFFSSKMIILIFGFINYSLNYARLLPIMLLHIKLQEKCYKRRGHICFRLHVQHIVWIWCLKILLKSSK